MKNDELPPELLAGYVDGELAYDDRLRVEMWLRSHPDARELLDSQELFSPSNRELWSTVGPPMPEPCCWKQMLAKIRGSCNSSRAAWRRFAGATSVFATAATIVIAIGLSNRPCPHGPEMDWDCPNKKKPVESISDEEPLSIARNDEVEIIEMSERAAPHLIVGKSPLEISPLILARPDEILIWGYGPDSLGRFPDVPKHSETSTNPMVWTASFNAPR